MRQKQRPVVPAGEFLQLMANAAGMTSESLAEARQQAAAKSRQLSVGLAISEARRAKAMTQAELAQLAGTTQPELSKLEQGKLNATIDTLIEVASALDLSLELRPINRGAVTTHR